MKILFSHKFDTPRTAGEELRLPTLQEDIIKTRQALEIAYAGFDNAVDADMIDSYIFEINALLKRYKHLSALAGNANAIPLELSIAAPARALAGTPG